MWSSRYIFALPQEQRETSTQFKLWHLIDNMEPAILTWDGAIHQGHLPLPVEVLSSIFNVRVHYHCALPLAVYLHLKSTHPSVCLQISDREIDSLSKMDGSWSDMSCVATWFCLWALFRILSTNLWTQADTIVVAGFNIVNPFRRM